MFSSIRTKKQLVSPSLIWVMGALLMGLTVLAGVPGCGSGGSSSDPDGDVLFFEWDFGDGSTGEGIRPNHFYETIGNFTVTLFVSDSGNLSSTAQTWVLVSMRTFSVIFTEHTVTIPTLAGYTAEGDETIEQYAIRLAEAWKIGRDGVDDGVIMLFAMQDRKMRIEVGYGLEGALTDALSKRIITNVITPDFRSGHFYSGIDGGVDVVISAISGEELPPAVRQQTSSNDDGILSGLGPFLLIFGFVWL